MAELAIVTTAAGAVLTVLLEKIAAYYRLGERGQLGDVKREVQRLQSMVQKIRIHLADAEENQAVATGGSDGMWLKELRDTAYDAEDVLDEFAAGVRRREVGGSKKLSSFFSSLLSREDSKLKRKLVEIWTRLENSSKERAMLDVGVAPGGSRGGGGAVPAGRKTSSLPNESCTFGREKEVGDVVDFLLASDDEPTDVNYSVLAIAGMGGIGKTTLAQLVRNHERIQNHFNPIMWLHVSHSSDVETLTKEMLESASEVEPADLKNLDRIQRNLKKELLGKRFLLVLDDVWGEDRVQWETLCKPLRFGMRGSRILMTTRNKKVAESMGTTKLILLEPLPDDVYWGFFRKCAFGGQNSSPRPKLEAIGRKIAERLRGSPLAAKAVGSILRSNLDEREWTKFLYMNIFLQLRDENDILQVLRLSYRYLPSHLKQCFAYCSIFPKGYNFERAELVQTWMAQGFIQPRMGTGIEDAGNEYFDDLVCRSFFKQLDGDKYVMHDLLHDLAQIISMDECFRIEDDFSGRIPSKVRHVSFLCNDIKWDALDFDCLKKSRTLLLIPSFSKNHLPENLFLQMRYIRVLILRLCCIIDLPSSIGSLKCLRYLDVSCTGIEMLPKTLITLYNLQTLKLQECYLETLPNGMANLINLRHLEAESELVCDIPDIGKLVHLQKLEIFKVRKQNGYRIQELADINGLQGSLSILNLENVESGAEATNAKLSSKQRLEKLELAWACVGLDDRAHDEDVLEGLRPHRDLKELTIECYGGIRSPSWMDNLSLGNLEDITLCDCGKWEVLPPLGQLPFLRTLQLKGMHGVKGIRHDFSSGTTVGFHCLKDLLISGMPEWEKWPGISEGLWFPCIHKHAIHSCPKLRELPPLPPTLTKLEIVKCPNLTSLRIGVLQRKLNDDFLRLSIGPYEESTSLAENETGAPIYMWRPIMGNYCEEDNMQEGFGPPLLLMHQGIGWHRYFINKHLATLTYQWPDHISLTDLLISGCPQITSLPKELLRHFKKLEKLSIRDCGELTSLALQALVSLKSLSIKDCPMLMSLGGNNVPTMLNPHSPSSLLDLEIMGCPNVNSHSLATCLQDLTSLSSLEISGCLNITSLHGDGLRQLAALEVLKIKDSEDLSLLDLQFLVSLKHLTIKNCPNLTALVFGEEGSCSLPLQFLWMENTLPVLPGKLSSLHRLHIVNCPLLMSFTVEEEIAWKSLSSLQYLQIVNCENLCSLPMEFQSLSSLEVLKIANCPQIRALLSKCLPPFLKELSILGCPVLKKQCQKGGPDWEKIVSIPIVNIF